MNTPTSAVQVPSKERPVNEHFESSEDAQELRRRRWAKRSGWVSAPLSVRMDRAAAIILRATMKWASSKAILKTDFLQLANIHDAARDLFHEPDDEPTPRGISYAREACSLIQIVCGCTDLAGGDFPKIKMDDLNRAYDMALTMADKAREQEGSAKMKERVRKGLEGVFSCIRSFAGNDAGESGTVDTVAVVPNGG